MFKSHRNRGFQMVFANGYTVSVQFGGNNYCSFCGDEKYGAWRYEDMEHSSPDAEVAIWQKGGPYIDLEKKTSDVFSYQTPDQVAKIISIVSSW